MRRRIIIFSIIFIVLVGGGSLTLFLVNRSPALQNAVYKATNTAPSVNSATAINTTITKPATTPDRESTVFIARNFTETYGSFSNQNNGSNLIDAKTYATASFSADLQAQATTAQVAPPAKEYSGTVTKALVFTSLKLTTISSQILVSTQQAVTTGTSTKNQGRELLVDLLKVDGEWKVNAAVWK